MKLHFKKPLVIAPQPFGKDHVKKLLVCHQYISSDRLYHCSLPHSSFGKLGNLDRARVCPTRCIRCFRWWRLDQSLQVAIYLFIFIWKQSWRGRQINDRQQIEIFIYWFNGQRWIGPKPGAENFFQVSHVIARTQAIWPSSTAFPDCYLGAGLELVPMCDTSTRGGSFIYHTIALTLWPFIFF